MALDDILKYIGVNRFTPDVLEAIDNSDLKKLYVLYLTPLGIIKVFSECSEGTCHVVKGLILNDIPFLYERIIKYSTSTSLTPKLLAGLVRHFGIDYL